MTAKYLNVMFTDAVRRAQTQYYGTAGKIAEVLERDLLGPDEAEFIGARDSFYLSSVSENGWPYIQHRGGPAGFLQVLNPGALAFADYRGNRQLLSTGHVLADDRVALFLMDYKNRQRLKILGHARIEDARAHPELVARVTDQQMWTRVERLVFIDVVAFDWNCSMYIAPRYLLAEVEALAAPLRARIAELEARLQSFNS